MTSRGSYRWLPRLLRLWLEKERLCCRSTDQYVVRRLSGAGDRSARQRRQWPQGAGDGHRRSRVAPARPRPGAVSARGPEPAHDSKLLPHGLQEAAGRARCLHGADGGAGQGRQRRGLMLRGSREQHPAERNRAGTSTNRTLHHRAICG